jgi:hypothetical protein
LAKENLICLGIRKLTISIEKSLTYLGIGKSYKFTTFTKKDFIFPNENRTYLDIGKSYKLTTLAKENLSYLSKYKEILELITYPQCQPARRLRASKFWWRAQTNDASGRLSDNDS